MGSCTAVKASAARIGLWSSRWTRSRRRLAVKPTSRVFLLILGLIPKLGAAVASQPGPVIGSAATAMFAMVTAVGTPTLHKVNGGGNHNPLIIAVGSRWA
jgi:NCS2 family nucleobase:cation symporter-2